MSGTPTLDDREAEAIAIALLQQLPAYVPNWKPTANQASWALVQIFARYVRSLAERLNQAPDKNKLAFLDRLGVNLLPAQAGRAPVVFQALTNVADSRVPVRTRVGAKVAGRSEPLMFETETAIALATAQIAQVVTLLPNRDAYADHTEAAIARQPFTLFEPLQPIPHELYLAHDSFAIAGRSTIELQFDLTQTARESLAIVWEFWSGKDWHPFKPFVSIEKATDQNSLDGTQGLKFSSTIRLVTDCATSAPTRINGILGDWIRARLNQPLPPSGNLVLPQIDRLQIQTVIRQDVWSQTLRLKDLEGAATPTLSGSIKDAKGMPLPEVLVFVGDFFSIASGYTDAQGNYRFEIPATLATNLTCRQAGFTDICGQAGGEQRLDRDELHSQFWTSAGSRVC
ncbi:MAG: hypothetical protein HC895_16060 [Leptolyngbyaceae cyanobacterium SM1_3_5]|nr:hypothetical protein [Leptolyngbyaceae cyanobacterium SM1_3_5]